MNLYSHLKKNVIYPIFKRYGVVMNIRRTVNGEYNSGTGETGAATITDLPTVGIIHSVDRVTASQLMAIANVDKTMVESSKTAIYVSAKNVNIVPGKGGDDTLDELIILGDTYTVTK